MDIRAKYNKVKTLAERGATDGERAAARAALERMEERHPELKQGSGVGDQGSRPYSVCVYHPNRGWVDITGDVQPMSYTSANSAAGFGFYFSRYWT